MSFVVTGGAGYVGSEMVRLLVRLGRKVSVIDDLRSGHRDAIPADVPLLETDIADRAAVVRFLREREATAVFHFASRIAVGESVIDPRLHYRGNLAATIALLDSVLDANVRDFIFSSSAAVYGAPLRTPIDEEHPTMPINAYGETKVAIEHMLSAYGRAYRLRWAALRYFNAAGPGERHDPETHLIPLVIDAAVGRRPFVTVFGRDYPTADGTCIRDYVHVADLADAHLAALDYLQKGGPSGPFNLGSGVGHSVREVIATVARIAERQVPVRDGTRREGDPAVLVASPARAERSFGWKAKRSALDRIVGDALASLGT